jgi:hypothetical protein
VTCIAIVTGTQAQPSYDEGLSKCRLTMPSDAEGSVQQIDHLCEIYWDYVLD